MPNWIPGILHHLKTQEMCAKAASMHSLSLELELYILAYAPDYFKTKEVVNNVVTWRTQTKTFPPKNVFPSEQKIQQQKITK